MRNKITLLLGQDDMEDITMAMAMQERTVGPMEGDSNLNGKTLAEICRMWMFMINEGCVCDGDEDEEDYYD